MDSEETRLYLHALLLANFPGLTVYYRPPGNLELTRPCIVYEAQAVNPVFANNTAYILGMRYQVMFLSNLPGYLNAASMYTIAGISVSSNNTYVSADIVHDVYIITVNSIT